jgi:hypothetical protein
MEQPVIVPQIRLDFETPPVVPPPAQEQPAPPPTAEQTRLADGVFAQQEPTEKEVSAMAGLFGLWSGTLLLHDLMAEHLSRPDELDEFRRKQRESDLDPEDPGE